MKNTTLEVLVILTLVPGGNIQSIVSPFGGIVTQAASDRIAAVSLPAGNLAALGESDLIGQIITERSSQLDLAGLTDEEKLFVSAWLSRKSELEKQRAGDGKDWDASGFSPP